ncbi:MAG: hypothetical protein ACFB3T_10310, partial [Geminicoccaceae bacterium]
MAEWPIDETRIGCSSFDHDAASGRAPGLMLPPRTLVLGERDFGLSCLVVTFLPDTPDGCLTPVSLWSRGRIGRWLRCALRAQGGADRLCAGAGTSVDGDGFVFERVAKPQASALHGKT